MPGLVSLANDSGLELDANDMNDEHIEQHDSDDDVADGQQDHD